MRTRGSRDFAGLAVTIMKICDLRICDLRICDSDSFKFWLTKYIIGNSEKIFNDQVLTIENFSL